MKSSLKAPFVMSTEYASPARTETSLAIYDSERFLGFARNDRMALGAPVI